MIRHTLTSMIGKMFGHRQRAAKVTRASTAADVFDQASFFKTLLLIITLTSTAIVVSLFIFETDENVELRGETVSGLGNQILRAFSKAYVSKIEVRDGDHVKRSQNILALVDPLLEKRLEDGRAMKMKIRGQLNNSKDNCSLQLNSLRNRADILAQLQAQKDSFYKRMTNLRQYGAISQMQVEALRSETLEAKSSIYLVEQEILQTRKTCADQQSDLGVQIEKIRQEEGLLRQDIRNLGIRAPSDGFVYDLSAISVGTVVEPGERLASFVPDSDVRIRVSVPSKEVALLKVGQQVTLRYDAYPFTKYGSMNGKISSIAPQRRFSMDLDNLTQSDSARANGGALQRDGEFTVMIQPQSQYLKATKTEFRVRPGLAVTVLVKLRSRKVIEYATTAFRLFYDPITRVR